MVSTDRNILLFGGLMSCMAVQTSLFLSGSIVLLFAISLVSGVIALRIDFSAEEPEGRMHLGLSSPVLIVYKNIFSIFGVPLRLNKVSYFCFNLSLFFGLSLALCNLLFNEYISILVLYFACSASAVAFALMMQKLVNRETV